MPSLTDTKERALPDDALQTLEDYLVFLKHAALYDVASARVSNSRVLDLGCGEGYGSAMLARAARFVVAVDYDRAAVAHAAQKYARVAFVVCDAQRLPFTRAAFDAVVSFEVIEHISNVASYLAEIRRVMRANATAIISTPNRALRLLPFQKPWNRFHLREYAARDFARALAREFARVELRGIGATARVMEIEKRRVKQNPFTAYPKMIAQSLVPRALYESLKRFTRAHAARPATSTAFRREDFSTHDYELTNDTRACINLVAICES